MNVNERIEHIIESLDYNKNSFSVELGLKNNSTIGQIVSGRNKPSFDILNKIANRFPQINMRWVLTGEGNYLKNEIQQVSEPPTEYGVPFLLKENEFLKDQIRLKDAEIERLWELVNRPKKAM